MQNWICKGKRKVIQKYMALFDNYKKRHGELMKKLQSFEEFEKSDKLIGRVMNIARQVIQQPGDVQATSWLLSKGAELSAYYGAVEARANEARAEYEAAEIAQKSTRDGLMLSLKGGDVGVTEARAQAGLEMVDSEIDVVAKKQRSDYYSTVARACEKMVSFVQSTLRHKEAERNQTKIAERGLPQQPN